MNRVRQAAALAAQGFRIVPTKDKVAIAAEFGADQPDATFGPEWFADADAVGILCGPCPALGDRRLICLDVDGDPKNCPAVNDLLQSLPPTLSSRNGAHRFFWVSAEHAAALKQWVDVLGTKAATGVAVDLKWEGGYACERGDWDGPLDPTAIAELPSPVRQTFVALRGADAAPVGAGAPDATLLRDAGFDPVQTLEDAAGWLMEAAPLPVDGKGGSALMVVMGALLVGFGLDAHDARELAMAFYYPRAWPGEDVDEKQLDHKIDEIERHGSTTFEPLQLAHAARNERTMAQLAAELDATSPPNGDLSHEAEVNPPRKSLNLVSAADLAKPRPPVNWLCDRLAFTAGRAAIIAGAGGSGKTVVAQQLALSVAAGLPMFGQWPLQQGPVLHLDLDQGEHATAVRYQQLARGMGLDLASLPLSCSFFDFYITKVDRERRIGYSVDISQSVLLRDTCRGYALVIIDSLRSVSRGMDENDSEIGEVVGAFAEIAESLKKEALRGGPPAPVFLLIHHSGKNAGAELRGSKAIEDKAGSVWTITRKPGEGVATWEQRKNSELSFTHRAPFRTCVTLDETQEAVRVDLAPEADHDEGQDGGEDTPAKWNSAMLAALEAVDTWPGINRRQLQERVGNRRAYAQKVIDALVLGTQECGGARLYEHESSGSFKYYRDTPEVLILRELKKGPATPAALVGETSLPPTLVKDECSRLYTTKKLLRTEILGEDAWQLNPNPEI